MIAYHFQVLNASAEETKLLAGHIGHKVNIHLSHYAMLLSILESTKGAKILREFTKGKVTKLDLKTDVDKVYVYDEDVIAEEGKQILFV